MGKKFKWEKKKDVIEALKELEDELGYSPTQSDAPFGLVGRAYDLWGEGGWNKAKKTAGQQIYGYGTRMSSRTEYIRRYLNKNPSYRREIIHKLGMTHTETNVLSSQVSGIEYIEGESGDYIYYLKGQKHLAEKRRRNDLRKKGLK